MPASERAFQRLDSLIEEARRRGDQGKVDRLLEERHRWLTQATDWDAMKWGFDPDDPMWRMDPEQAQK